MKKLIYKLFGEPIISDTNSGIVGSSDGRLYIDKPTFYNRKDVQKVIESVKKSEVVKSQIEKSKKQLKEGAL